MRREYIRNKNVCKVTFRLPKSLALQANKVSLVGDFSNWDPCAYPMERMGNGDYCKTLYLLSGMEYRFGYLVDESKWVADKNADKFVKREHGNRQDSVVIV